MPTHQLLLLTCLGCMPLQCYATSTLPMESLRACGGAHLAALQPSTAAQGMQPPVRRCVEGAQASGLCLNSRAPRSWAITTVAGSRGGLEATPVGESYSMEKIKSSSLELNSPASRLPHGVNPDLFDLWFLVCYAATQLALQLQQERIQVVCK